MIAQHILTLPVFEALFEGYDFASGNPIATALDELRRDFGEFGLENEIRDMEPFYESVRRRARGLDNSAARQQVLKELYEHFFRVAVRKQAERLFAASEVLMEGELQGGRAHPQRGPPPPRHPLRPSAPLYRATLSDLHIRRFDEDYLPGALDPKTLAANDRTTEERLAAARMILSVEDPVPTVVGILALGRSSGRSPTTRSCTGPTRGPTRRSASPGSTTGSRSSARAGPTARSCPRTSASRARRTTGIPAWPTRCACWGSSSASAWESASPATRCAETSEEAPHFRGASELRALHDHVQSGPERGRPMSEGQHLEWKTAWRDDHLKAVCAFANADGGRLDIGRDDQGRVVGIGARERRRLLEELPNKLRDLLGIVAAVKTKEEDGIPYLRIVVEAYPVPISYRGTYYQRSGSTNQILQGPALDRFLLGRTGRCWDGIPDPRVALEDLDPTAIAGFRKRAARERRLAQDALDEDDAGLIEKLRLTDGDYLTKAGILLFHHDPERFVAGAHVKIGYFTDDSDVRFHDVISGDLFTQVDTTIELLLFKYLKAGISYEGIQRVERYPMPEPALREALLNAVVHRDYAVAASIQIRVQDDRLLIYNPGSLPEGWTLERLLGPHPSRPYNPDIANAFFWAGEIETWGRGIDRVFRACRRAGTTEPNIRLEPGGLWFEFEFSDEYLESVGVKRGPGAGATGSEVRPQVGPETVGPDDGGAANDGADGRTDSHVAAGRTPRSPTRPWQKS